MEKEDHKKTSNGRINSYTNKKGVYKKSAYGNKMKKTEKEKDYGNAKSFDEKFRTQKWSDKKEGTNSKSYKNTYVNSIGDNKPKKKTQKTEKRDRTYTASYIVDRSDTLLEFLLKKCKTSRNNVKTLLAKKKVLVNGSVVTQYNFVLAKDDEIKLAHDSVLTDDGRIHKEELAEKRNNHIKDKEKLEKPDYKKLIKIIYEDDDFIAINKPCGLLSVESDNETQCAFSFVFNYLKSKDKNLRPFILHRIDKETSGVLVFAKNVKIHSMLKTNWNDLVSTREYMAVIEGVPKKKEDTIESFLKENENNLMYSTNDPSGQKAITHYEVENKNDKFALLKVNIYTGRKNQIRVHMHELGHPVVGDEKYGCTKDPLKRLGLHASKLEFTHPISKELITFVAPTPSSFFELFR